jgi:PhnB protein
MHVKPIPDGYHAVTPYLIVRGAREAIEFYTRALGAVELYRLDGPEGRIGHAELQIGDCRVMLADEAPAMGALSPTTLGGAGVHLMLYVEDVDARFAQAIAAGGRETRPVKDQFYGDRSGIFVDPFGYQWTVATHVEDVPPAEMERRAAEAVKASAAG